MSGFDPAFAALPLDALADAGLSVAAAGGASHADVRVERVVHRYLSLHDAVLDTALDATDVGVAVRVVVDGCWGFAATTSTTADAAADAARRALALAAVARPLATEAVRLADEPAHRGQWLGPCLRDPVDAPREDVVGQLAEWSATLLGADGVAHANATLSAVREAKFYADLAGSRTLQQRVRLDPDLTVIALSDGARPFASQRSVAPPTARGLEYLDGDGWDFAAELATLPALLAEAIAAPSVTPGRYDLVIDPTNLWLTIHESVGHATELDRALGYEANYAGTSFATPDQLGSLRYGSAAMTVTGDRTVAHGLATTGWDDDGVATQSFDLVRDGVLVGYQLDRVTAARAGLARSNGCAFADSPGHMPIQRMANVSLAADPTGPDLAGLIAGVEDGLYVVGDRSWSIDMQRYNFQFTGQRFYRIRAGRLAGQVGDVAYQATTTDFWGSMEAVGGPATYLLAGATNCGKAQPGQVAAVSHGSPAALFRGVRVLNTASEGAA